MTSQSVHKQPAVAAPGPVELLLANWPLRDDGPLAWLVVIGAVAASVTAGFVAQSAVMGVVSFLALSIALWRLWVPVTFELGPRGVVQILFGRRRRIAWSSVARYEVRRHGVLLLSEETQGPAAALRGLYVRWGRHREELLAVIAHYLGNRPSPNRSP
jgi:hypothetical protein